MEMTPPRPIFITIQAESTADFADIIEFVRDRLSQEEDNSMRITDVSVSERWDGVSK